MLVVNLFGAPGSGKSTLALLVAGLLKTRHNDLTIECPDEFPKLLVYDEAHKAFDCQLYVAGRQMWQIARCHGFADIVVCDSPVLLSAVYGRMLTPPVSESFRSVCLEYHRQFHSLNYFVRRDHAYEQKARNQTPDEAELIGDRIQAMLAEFGIDHELTKSAEVTAIDIAYRAAAQARLLKARNVYG